MSKYSPPPSINVKPVKSSIGAQENAVFDQVITVTEFELLCGESSSLFEGRVRALCLVTAFRQVACRNRTDRSYHISPIIIYNLSFPFESDNMNLFELVQDPPIMLVVAVVHNA